MLGVMRVSPVSALTVAVLPSTIVAVPRRVRTLAFFRRPPTPLVSRVTIESFQAMVRAKSSFGGPIDSPIAFERPRLPEAMGGAGGMDQRFRRDAADVEAGSAKPVGFDEDRVEAELAGADRRDIAAGAAADDENLAAKLVHASSSKPGSLSPPRKRGSRRQFGPRAAPRWLPALLDTGFRGYDKPRSLLDEQRGRGLDQRPQALDEGRGVMAVDHAMIERGREVHDLRGTKPPSRQTGLDDDLVDADDRHFRPVDDRRRGDAAERAKRGQRDRRAGKLVARGDALARRFAHPPHFARAFVQAERLGMANDRHHKPVRRLRRDAQDAPRRSA